MLYIVSQIVEFVENCKGVMIFVVIVEYVWEVIGLLLVGQVVLIIGEMSGLEWDCIIEVFKVQVYCYLVNVVVLIIGFDVLYVDLIVIFCFIELVSFY